MNKMAMGMMVLGAVLLAGSARAVLLVEEGFDYGVGSASSSWTGGVGFASSAWATGTTGTTLDQGLTLGSMQVAGGSAHIQFTAGAGFSAGTMGRALDTSSVTNGPLWMAYLFQFDTVRSTIADDEWLEVRPGAGDIRMAIDETLSAVELRYGGDTTTSSSDMNVKSGATLLYVAKFPDMGSPTGSDAKGWVLNALEYNGMMTHGGLSETNLDTYAGLQLSNSFNADSIMAGNVTLQLVPQGRNSSTPSFFVDELRLGTELQDVVSVMDPTLPTGILLVEESWDYGVGSAASSWTGGVGFASSAWSIGTTGTTLEDGLVFGGMQVEGGSAHIQFTAGAGFSAGTLGRSLSTYSVAFGDLWMAYLFQFDTARSTIADDEWLEIRPGAGDMRTGIDETLSSVELRYGADTTTSSSDTNVKNGTILLYVAKFSDMGSATGADAKGWALTASEYDSMLANGGVTESNLTVYAGIQLSNSFNPDSTMAGNVTLQLIPLGRNSSTPSFYIDELRLGTSLDVVAPVIPPSGSPTIIGWSALSGAVMKMVVDAPGNPVDYSPVASLDLGLGGWINVAHSDDGVNPFIVTNLDYSTVDATGTNEVIYVQSNDAIKFFRVNVE